MDILQTERLNLRRLGMRFERMIRLSDGGPQVRLLASETGRGPMHYLLFYDVVSDYVVRRQPLRAAHLEYARAFIERGDLVLAGALADPVDGAVLLFRGQTPEVARTFAAADPYVLSGLVTDWRVRQWTTVVGPQAEVPLP